MRPPVIYDNLSYIVTCRMRPPLIYDHLSNATTCRMRPPVINDRFLCVFDSVLIGYEPSVDDHMSYPTIFYGSSGGPIREDPLYIIYNRLSVSLFFHRMDSHIGGHQNRFQEMRWILKFRCRTLMIGAQCVNRFMNWAQSVKHCSLMHNGSKV